MAFTNNVLATLMHKRMQWLNRRAQVVVGNIASADNRGATRKDIVSFQKILQKNNFNLNQGKPLEINEDDIFDTKHEISKEMESLELTRNASEYDALLTVIKSWQRMFKAVMTKPQ